MTILQKFLKLLLIPNLLSFSDLARKCLAYVSIFFGLWLVQNFFESVHPAHIFLNPLKLAGLNPFLFAIISLLFFDFGIDPFFN